PFNGDSVVSYSRDTIMKKFTSLTAFRPLEVTNYDLLAQLSSCPTGFRGSTRGLYNCAMDSSFATAVSMADVGEPLTVAEAIDQGYLDGDWPLISPQDSAKNQDAKCYTYGFCYSNLVKLRKARIIPVGWEMAAASDANFVENPITLQEVIDSFNDCNSDGELDDEHPWCHLIDPNWILKAPDTQCRTMAYGQLLSAPNTSERAQECVDLQSCISEDENGNCDTGYGYCVREENTWEFRGDECPEEYAGCMSFVDADPLSTDSTATVSFITDTIDYGQCDADSVNCLWYATQKEENDDGDFDWPSIDSVVVADAEADAYKNRLYFNGNVETCDEDNGGCQEIVERGSDLDVTLNMIANSSFENDSDEDSWPDSWIMEGGDYDTENDQGRSGDAAYNPGSTGEIYQFVTLMPSRFYTISAYAKQNSGTSEAKLGIFITDADGEEVDMSGVSYTGDADVDCTLSDNDGDGTKNGFVVTLAPTDSEYERFDCTFATTRISGNSDEMYAKVSVSDGDIWVDNIQLEQSATLNSYHYEYSDSSLSYDYLKVAPSYLGCDGSDDDPEECDNYAPVCSADESGCSLYTPANGDPSVSGIVNELDACPSVCAGYDTFRQEATLYEPNGEFPVYFIPDTATQCSAEAVGCDEFTNLSDESKEYYTYLRACVTTDQADANTNGDNGAIFYTWEGSDEEGYQLKTWNLLESDLDGSAYSPYTYADSGEQDNAPGSAPCTNWTTTADGVECSDDADGDGMFDAETADCDEYDDIVDNPDCREFYDVDGNVHYREWSNTVTVNDECVSYRKTDIVGNDSTEKQANCEDSGGYYNEDGGFCVYYGYSEESNSCSASENGCRQYTGGRSANSRIAFKDYFEAGSLDNWDAADASTVELSNESIATDGHSLKAEGVSVYTYLYEESGGCSDSEGCSSDTGNLGGECTVQEGETYCGTLEDELFTDKTYTLSLWAKGQTDLNIYFETASGTRAEFDTIELEDDWQEFSLGPLDMNEDDYPDFGSGTILVIEPAGSGDYYIDNVVLREGEDDITVIKDSWETPGVCDSNLEGESDPQYFLGCREYTDQNDETTYLKSFSSLCSEEKVGCQGYYLTGQSDSPYSTVYNATCYNVDTSGASTAWSSADTAEEATTCYLFTSEDGTEFDTSSKPLCTISTGEDSCLFDMEDWFIPEGEIEVGVGNPALY
ncbi:hypothetical protein D6827_00910, partial [Candidatus Parcubacteria bacterium]